ncbi:MAG: 16S rRNA (guanine(966)-N(2))-methyltransferase RsmD [Coriobacteriales bacterium]|nr:16S rRNA (guanine(966)-N(2))-methyltransferase RsmD [Coriobacteriales bacterium]
MRIVGGTLRGRAFEAPEGRDTRPTTDRMRESIASMVLSACDLDLSNCSVLDAFAGSGAMGLELCSRGAERCTFVERNGRAARVVRRNCQTLLTQGTWDVLTGDMVRLATKPRLPGSPFDLVFLDPPYAMSARDVSAIVANLAVGGHLARGCLFVYERAAKAPGLLVEGAYALRSRSHGGTCIDLMRMDSQNG